MAEGVAERAGLHSGLAEPLRTYGIWQSLAFASPICCAPQGRAVSVDAWAKEQICKRLPLYLLVEGLCLELDSFVLMYSEHQGLPRKDKSSAVLKEPPNSGANVTSDFHGPYKDTTLYIFQGLSTSSTWLAWCQLWG